MKYLLSIVLLLVTGNVVAQIPKNGIYSYRIKWAEWNGMPGPKVKVVIKHDSIFVFAMDNSLTNIKSGELFEKGKILYHKKSKQWIIASSPEDADAEEVGGCSDGPTVINFKHRWYWMC